MSHRLRHLFGETKLHLISKAMRIPVSLYFICICINLGRKTGVLKRKWRWLLLNVYTCGTWLWRPRLMRVLSDPFDDNNPASQHGVNFFGAVTTVYESRSELPGFRKLQSRPVQRHRPVEVGKNVGHVVHLEPEIQKNMDWHVFIHIKIKLSEQGLTGKRPLLIRETDPTFKKGRFFNAAQKKPHSMIFKV